MKAQQFGDTLVVYRPEKFHKFVINLNNRNSFLGPDPISVYGVKAAITVHHRWRFGLGYHQLLTPQVIHFSYENKPYEARLSFWYASVYAEWVIIHRKIFEISAPLVYAIGAAPVLGVSDGSQAPFSGHSNMQLAELSVNGYYKIFNWIGPGIGVGYRMMLNGNDFVRQNFSAPVFVLRVQIFLDPLYHDLFPHGIMHKS